MMPAALPFCGIRVLRHNPVCSRRSGCRHGPRIDAIDLEGTSISPDPHTARAHSCELGYPVVLKAPGTSHKSDAGAVVLGIIDKTALARSFNDRPRRLNPPALP